MKTKGLTREEARISEDSTIRLAQEICDYFKEELVGIEFEQVMLLVKKAKLEGYKEAGHDLFKKL